MANKLSKEATELFTTDTVEEEEMTVDTTTSESVPMEDLFNDASESPVDYASLFDTDIDPEDLAEKQAASYLEKGKYTWHENKVNINIFFNDDDKNVKDLAQRKGLDKGRSMVAVSGIITNGTRKGRFSFMLSPDQRFINDQPDFASQAYTKVCEYYFKKYETRPKKESDLLNFLQNGHYAMYITRGKNGGNYLGNFQNV